jgi:hypothetical protein
MSKESKRLSTEIEQSKEELTDLVDSFDNLKLIMKNSRRLGKV